jgi:NDP-sugar pyrophosphorylase family protein
MHAVILAGGEGTRLRPLTSTIPKAMVPVLNQPFLVRMLERLIRHGVTHADLTLGYRAADIEAHFPHKRFRSMQLRFAREETPLGTAGGVAALRDALTETFVVMNGDIYTDLPVSDAVTYHHLRKAAATIVLTPVDDPTPYGMVETAPDGRILRFVEKPSHDQVTTVWVNAGTYILEPSVLDLVPPGKPTSFERQVFPQLLASGAPVYAFKSTSYWSDLGTPARYLECHKQLLMGRTDAQIPGQLIKPGVWAGNGWSTDASATLNGPILLGTGCVIGAGAVLQGPLVLGDGVVVGEDARVSNSILWAGCRVGEKATVDGSILGQRVLIGNGASLSGCVIADGALVGANNRLERGFTLGPDKKLEDSAVFFLP